MYLDHFGLAEPPFRITPHTEFFFSGANRGATLDALLYAASHEEGIVKISGEVGSGKTMLCRVLMERLPKHVNIVSIKEQIKAKESLEQTHGLLQAEQSRSEKLLLNTLPATIAERLKHSDKIIADGYASASVMFADIVGFTQLASGMTPMQVFSMLNHIFSSFDDLTDKFRLEKIKTIGDAYMVAGGINDGNEDYVAAVADLALAMCELLKSEFDINGTHMQMRIGIRTGPVIAGVVGKKKSSTTYGATPSTLPAALPRKARRA